MARCPAPTTVHPVRSDRLTVVVRVQIHKARCDEQTGRVDLAGGATVGTPADCRNGACRTARSPTCGAPPRPSTIVPLRMTRSPHPLLQLDEFPFGDVTIQPRKRRWKSRCFQRPP